MSVIDEFLANNEAYAGKFTKGSLPMPPAKQIAAVVCMDARLETGVLLGLAEGALTRTKDWRTSSSRSVKASIAKGGFIPVSICPRSVKSKWSTYR